MVIFVAQTIVQNKSFKFMPAHRANVEVLQLSTIFSWKKKKKKKHFFLTTSSPRGQ